MKIKRGQSQEDCIKKDMLALPSVYENLMRT